MNPTSPQQLDQDALNLAKAIRKHESNDNFTARGGSGEFGAYQFMPDTWKGLAKEFLGDEKAPLTPENQNKAAYSRIKQLKDQGYKASEIASIWNSGQPKWEGKVGTNKYGVKYDVPAYVNRIQKLYEEEKMKSGATQAPVNNPLGAKSAYAQSAQGGLGAKPPSIGGFAGNVLKSGGRLIGSTVNALVHPFKTIGTLGKLGAGAVSNAGEALGLGGGETKSNHMFDQLAHEYGRRYGKDLTKTLYEDPVGVLADLSVILGGAAGVAGKVGEVGKLGTVSEIGSKLGAVADATNPLTYAGKAVGKVGELAKNTTTKAIGYSTGAGEGTFKQIFNAAEEGRTGAAKAMRGGVKNPEELVTQARQSLGQIFKKRGEEYRSGIDKIDEQVRYGKNGQLYVKRPITQADISAGRAPKSALGKTDTWVPTDISLKGLKDVATRAFKEVGIDAKRGALDFSKRPSMDGNSLQKISDLVYNWDDVSPKGINMLRQEISEFRKGGLNIPPSDRRFNSIIDKMTGNISDYLGERVPQYKEVNLKYAQDSNMIKSLAKGLSLGENTAPHTVLQKLMTALTDKKHATLREDLIKTLQENGGGELLDQIAGLNANAFMSHGLTPTFLGGALGAGAFTNPAALAGLPFLSPRFAGEAANALGKGSKFIKGLKLPENLAGKTAGAVGKQLFGKPQLLRNADLLEKLKESSQNRNNNGN